MQAYLTSTEAAVVINVRTGSGGGDLHLLAARGDETGAVDGWRGDRAGNAVLGDWCQHSSGSDDRNRRQISFPIWEHLGTYRDEESCRFRDETATYCR